MPNQRIWIPTIIHADVVTVNGNLYTAEVLATMVEDIKRSTISGGSLYLRDPIRSRSAGSIRGQVVDAELSGSGPIMVAVDSFEELPDIPMELNTCVTVDPSDIVFCEVPGYTGTVKEITKCRIESVSIVAKIED